VPFTGGGAFRRAASIGGAFDRLVVHFQPALYYRPRASLSKVATSLSLLWLVVRRRRTEIVVHEADRPTRWRPDYGILRLALRAAPRLLFHTAAEREALERRYRIHVRAALIPHRVDPVPAVAGVSKEEARRRLGIEAGGGPLFLSAGFLQPSKGFDRALEAFARAFGEVPDAGSGEPSEPADGSGNGSNEPPPPGATLYLVGSVREDTAGNRAYVEGLRKRAAEVPGVRLVERYLTDDVFDLWVAAADRVVLPYRVSWSSGVLARAHAVGTPGIVTATGGLAEQAEEGDVVVDGDDELTAALAEAARARSGPVGGAP